MVSKKKGGGIAAIVVAIVTVTGVGYYDFSTTVTNISQGDTTNIGGDTIIGQFIDEGAVAEAGLDIICNLDNVPTGYEESCEEWNELP